MSREPSVVLAGFRPVVLKPAVPQADLLNYMAWLMSSARCTAARASSSEAAHAISKAVRSDLLRFGVRPVHVAARQFNALPATPAELGATGVPPELSELFRELVEEPSGPSLDRRMRDFSALALEVFRRWYAEQSDAPEHLLHVTCSGYASPSPAQAWLSERRWYSTSVTHCYHMGCYAAFPAIRTAIGLLSPSILGASDVRGRVDIVHTEYLSNHLDPLQHEPGHLIDSTLFADGFIGYSAYTRERFESLRRPGLRLLAHHETLIPDSLGDMTWTLGPRHFEIFLSKNVPLAIEGALPRFVRKLCDRAGFDFEGEKASLLLAIHPGGPKILEHARAALGGSEAQVRHAQSVFHALGNMSSATIPHVFMQILSDESVPDGTRIVSAGFGPGLTATGFVLEKVVPSDRC